MSSFLKRNIRAAAAKIQETIAESLASSSPSNWSHESDSDHGASQYHCDGHGTSIRGTTLILPLIDESKWPWQLRVVIYVIALLNLFVGVNYSAKAFMGAIERIAHQTIAVKNRHPRPGEPSIRRVSVWNPVVATQALGAVGSGAPEILLTTIETVGHGFDSGKVGPGLVIGSTAFNLLVVMGACIVAVPSPHTKRVEARSAYILTSVFNICAFGWLIFVLSSKSYAVIEIWEAAVTVGLYFVLVFLAYVLDRLVGAKSKQQKNKENEENGDPHPLYHDNDAVSNIITVAPAASDETNEVPGSDPDGSVDHNFNGLRNNSRPYGWISNHSRRTPSAFGKNRRVSCASAISTKMVQTQFPASTVPPPCITNQIEFCSHVTYANPEQKLVLLWVLRRGDASTQCTVQYEVYIMRTKRTDAVGEGGGCLASRRSVWKDSIVFQKGETEQSIVVDAHNKYLKTNNYDDKKFYVRLIIAPGYVGRDQQVKLGTLDTMEVILADNAEQLNATIDAKTSGIKQGLCCGDPTMIHEDQEQIQHSKQFNEDMPWTEAWKSQFHEAMTLNWSNWFGRFSYVFVVGWRVLFAALIPPPQLCYGYPTFLMALFWIGLIEAVCGDLCILLGCLLGFSELIVASSILTVGTKLPHLLSSYHAAATERNADAAILHVSGGCCVSVFLGLGVPWLIASIYHSVHGTQFQVPVEELWNANTVCTMLCIISLIVLTMRRSLGVFGKSELGGPRCAKIVSAMVLFAMWQAHVIITYFQTIGYIRFPVYGITEALSKQTVTSSVNGH